MLIVLLLIWTVAVPVGILGLAVGLAWRRERFVEDLPERGIPVSSQLAGLRGVGSTSPTT